MTHVARTANKDFILILLTCNQRTRLWPLVLYKAFLTFFLSFFRAFYLRSTLHCLQSRGLLSHSRYRYCTAVIWKGIHDIIVYTHTCLSSVTQILLTTGVTGPSAQQCHSDHQCHSQAEHESGPPRFFFTVRFPKQGIFSQSGITCMITNNNMHQCHLTLKYN